MVVEPECDCVDCQAERRLVEELEEEPSFFCVKHNEPECIECADLEHWEV
jgi:hypothetical protein